MSTLSHGVACPSAYMQTCIHHAGGPAIRPRSDGTGGGGYFLGPAARGGQAEDPFVGLERLAGSCSIPDTLDTRGPFLHNPQLQYFTRGLAGKASLASAASANQSARAWPKSRIVADRVLQKGVRTLTSRGHIGYSSSCRDERPMDEPAPPPRPLLVGILQDREPPPFIERLPGAHREGSTIQSAHPISRRQ